MIVTTSGSAIALELDHGGSIGQWARQLTKAVRNGLSPQVSGIIFCYCLQRNRRVGDFTHQTAGLFEDGITKPLGILTIDRSELAEILKPSVDEVVKLLRRVYLTVNATPGANARARAARLVTAIVGTIPTQSIVLPPEHQDGGFGTIPNPRPNGLAKSVNTSYSIQTGRGLLNLRNISPVSPGLLEVTINRAELRSLFGTGVFSGEHPIYFVKCSNTFNLEIVANSPSINAMLERFRKGEPESPTEGIRAKIKQDDLDSALR